MNWIFAPLQQSMRRVCGMVMACVTAVTCAMAAGAVGAQTPQARITSEVTSSATAKLPGSLHPLARSENDAGRMAGNTRLNGISIYFNRTAAQQADLNALLAAQQDPSSPQYHQWLTPDQFAARFGMAQSDIDKVQSWLQQQGFAVNSVARSRNMIRFSGSVAQVESAFNTEMHYYNVGGVRHFAPSTALSVPAAIAPAVSGIRNLNDFRPRPQHVTGQARLRPGFTSGQTGNVYFAPGDIATAYDIQPLYSASFNGAGQSIAVMGQSAVSVSDIEAFQSAAGLTKKDPTMVIVPGSGDSTVVSGGDEGESDLDLEWSSAMAPGADVFFVYAGSDTNFSVFDSVAYAVDEKIGTILSLSYDTCEPNLAATDYTSLDAMFQQAASQGQSVFVASGDQGSTACFVENPPQSGDPTLAVQQALAVNYPASSAYVTAVGGTEISSADGVDPTTGSKGANYSTYWQSGSSDDVNSLIKYIPEVAWNDDPLSVGVTAANGGGLSASGGGASGENAAFSVPRPSWQKGVSGIPSGSTRLVPDVSLYSSSALPGYLICSSDTVFWGSTQQASCNSGFRDSSSNNLTVAGGTSFATPIFAGMLAVLNQAKGYTTGQGLVNSTLYSIAGGSGYASAFHDVTSGTNDCTAGSPYCASNGATLGFKAGTGYDEVTGLGSVDLNNLVTAWPAATGTAASLIASTTTVSASNSSPTSGQSVTFTITVAPITGSGVPTGTVNLSIDGGGTHYNDNNTGTTTSVTLTSNGTATYTTSFSASGVHEIVAQYAGDSTYATSVGSQSVTIATTSSGKGTFTLGATPSTLTVAQGSSGTETVNVTPAGGYTGTVVLSYSVPAAINNLCVFAGTGINSSGDISVPSASAVSAQLTIDTKAADCSSSTTVGAQPGQHGMLLRRTVAGNTPPPMPGSNKVPAGIAFAGLVLAGFLGRRSRKLRSAAWVLLLAAAGLALSACSNSSTNVIGNPPKGTYTITLSAADSVTSTNTGSTTFSLTIN